MPTLKFVLQQPYKERKPQKKSSDISYDESVLNGTKTANKTKRQLNPFETRLYACLIIDRNQVIKIKTEHVVYPAQWDFSSRQLKDKVAGSPEFNKKLAALKEKILAEYHRIRTEDYPPAAEIPFTEMRDKITAYGRVIEKPTVKKLIDFFQILDEYVDYLEGVVAESTRKKYITLKNSLKEFGKGNRHYETLTFSGIDFKFYDAYTKYLRNQKPRGKQKTRPEDLQKGLLIDTVGKYIECLKTFCTWASKRPSEKNPYNVYFYFQQFPKIDKADRKRIRQNHDIITLTLSELKQFYEHDFSNNPYLERVRDVFCFGAFTGTCYGDYSTQRLGHVAKIYQT